MHHWLDVGKKYTIFFSSLVRVHRWLHSISILLDVHYYLLVAQKMRLYNVTIVACIPAVRIFFFFWYLFVFQNNFQYHLDKTFHSELISCHYSVSTAQPLLKTGRSSGDLNVIATEGTYHRYRVDESYPAFVTSTVSRVLDILEICLTMQILHHWHCSMASKIYLI